MIVCKLIGGLGNQLFQYAYAMALAEQLHDDICLDNSFYYTNDPTILKFNIPYRNTVNDYFLEDYRRAKRKARIYHIQQKLIRSINHERIGERTFQRYSRQGYYFNFDPFYYKSIICESDNKYIYGYFQGEEYFRIVRTQVKEAFTLAVPMGKTANAYADQIETSNAVALHIRLGDYTRKKNQYLNICTDKYYINSIKYMLENIERPRFFVFSNDIQAVKQIDFLPGRTVYIENTKDFEELILMKSCKHFIISNSTFSWWGAYLSENITKMILTPDKWMTTLREKPAIYLPEMIKITY